MLDFIFGLIIFVFLLTSKMKPFYYLILLVVLWSSTPSFLYSIKQDSSSNGKRPDWLSNKLPDATNDSFFYQITSAKAYSLDSARNGAFKELINYIDQTNNIKISGEIITSSSSIQINRAVNETINKEYSYKYKIDSEELFITFRKVDEYWETQKNNKGEIIYHCYSLYMVSKNLNRPQFDKVSFSYKYGMSALWRSALVPGYGQIYKGSTAKGISILSGEVALITGILLTENTRSSYRRKAKETYDVNKIIRYTDKADNYETARNIFIGGAIALYVYNLIDAVASNGRKRTITNKRISFAPTIGTEHNGITFSLAF